MVVNCSDITFVFQGPYYSSANSRNSTCLAAESIKHYFPGSPIIFSTWNNPENSQFFDKIILNDILAQEESIIWIKEKFLTILTGKS